MWKKAEIGIRGLRLAVDVPVCDATAPAAESRNDVDYASLDDVDYASLDGTGIGLVWQRATDLLCDYLQQPAAVRLLLERGEVLELGAGVGVVGLVAAAAGARVILTDYHPRVLETLRSNITANGLSEHASVETLEWGAGRAGASRARLILGADLVVAERVAPLLASTLHSTLHEADGVFLYAHQERHAIFLGSDGAVCREEDDVPLMRLKEAAQPLRTRLLHTRVGHGEAERVLLLAFGSQLALSALPGWSDDVHAQPGAGVEAPEPVRQGCGAVST